MAGSDHAGRRRRRFQPFKKLQRLFSRRGKVHCSSGGVSEEATSASVDSPDVHSARSSAAARHPSHLSESQESVLAEDAGVSRGASHHLSSASIPSLPSSSSQLTAELRNVLTKKRSDGADDDSGLPRTPTTSPGVRLQQSQPKGSAARWGGSVSDGSLLSIYSSGTGTDEEPFGPLSSHSSKLSLARDNESGDLQLESAGPLSHAAAKHRIAVRPRRTRRPRTRGTALPATLEEGSPDTEAAPLPDDTGGGGGRRSPSVSPERARTRSTLPTITGGATDEPPAAVQRSRSSLADHRLRHLSPRKLFSRGGDSGAEKRSDASGGGGGGFFSRIFGSRRSGRKAKPGRETAPSPTVSDPTEPVPAPRAKQSPGPTENNVGLSQFEAEDSPREPKQAERRSPEEVTESDWIESARSDAGAAIKSADTNARIVLQDSPDLTREEGDKIPTTPEPQCKACQESEESLVRRHSKNGVTERRLSKQMDNDPANVSFKPGIESEEMSHSEDPGLDSDSSECSACLTDTASEGSPCILRRRNRTPEASEGRNSSSASDSQSSSSPAWTQKELRKAPPRAEIDRRTWTEPDQPNHPVKVVDAESSGSSTAAGSELRRSFPRYSAEQRKMAAISNNDGQGQIKKPGGESMQSQNDEDKRKTYTISDDQKIRCSTSSVNDVEALSSGTDVPESRGALIHTTHRQISAPDSGADVTKPQPKPTKAYRRSLPTGFLAAPKSCPGAEVTHSPARPPRRRPRSVSKLSSDDRERHPAVSPTTPHRNSSSGSSPEQQRGAAPVVALRPMGRADAAESGPQSLDSTGVLQLERRELGTRRRRSSPGKEVNVIARAFQRVNESSDSRVGDADREAVNGQTTSDSSRSSLDPDALELKKNVSDVPKTEQKHTTKEVEKEYINHETESKASKISNQSHRAPPSVKPKPSCANEVSLPQKPEETPEATVKPAVDDSPPPAGASATLTPCVPEFMKVQLHPVDAPLLVVSEVVVPKRPPAALLSTSAVVKKSTESAPSSRTTAQMESKAPSAPNVLQREPCGSEKATASNKLAVNATPSVGVDGKPVELPSVSSPLPCRSNEPVVAPTPPPPSKSPDSTQSTSSTKESPVQLRKKPAQANEESELAKVFKRRSLKIVGSDEASQKLQAAQSEPEQIKPSANVPPPSPEGTPAPPWRNQVAGAAAAKEAPSPRPSDSVAARSWKPAPSVPSRVRPAVGGESRGSVNAEPRRVSSPEDGVSDAVETAATPRAAAPVPAPRQTVDSRTKDDDSASTADWLKQTVRERREQREQREMKHLRQPNPKELIIEPETLVPGRTPAPRSSRVLAMANTFQKLQPT